MLINFPFNVDGMSRLILFIYIFFGKSSYEMHPWSVAGCYLWLSPGSEGCRAQLLAQVRQVVSPAVIPGAIRRTVNGQPATGGPSALLHPPLSRKSKRDRQTTSCAKESRFNKKIKSAFNFHFRPTKFLYNFIPILSIQPSSIPFPSTPFNCRWLIRYFFKKKKYFFEKNPTPIGDRRLNLTFLLHPLLPSLLSTLVRRIFIFSFFNIIFSG